MMSLPRPLEEIFYPLWRIPPHLGVFLALLDVPDERVAVLADRHDLQFH